MPRVRTIFAAAAAALVGAAHAETIQITAKSDHTFDPDTVQAKEGDVLQFHFQPRNHSVVSGNYDYPCSPLQLGTGFYSAFVPTENDEADVVFRVTVNNTDPLPFYSSQGDECSRGMVGIINPSANMTLDDYKQRAASLSRAVSPGRDAFGGQLVEDKGKGSSSSDQGSGSGDQKQQDKSKDNQGSIPSMSLPIAGLVAALGVAVVLL